MGKRLPASPGLAGAFRPSAATPLDRAGGERKDGYFRRLNGAAVWRPAVKAAREHPGRETAPAEAGPPEPLKWQQYP